MSNNASQLEAAAVPRQAAEGWALFRSVWVLPAILSVTAGIVDVVCFLALGGLFTAHSLDIVD